MISCTIILKKLGVTRARRERIFIAIGKELGVDCKFARFLDEHIQSNKIPISSLDQDNADMATDMASKVIDLYWSGIYTSFLNAVACCLFSRATPLYLSKFCN